MWTAKNIDSLSRQDILNICGGGDIFKFRDIYNSIFGMDNGFCTYLYTKAGVKESELKKGDLLQCTYTIYFTNEYDRKRRPTIPYPAFTVHRWRLYASEDKEWKCPLNDMHCYDWSQDLPEFINRHPEVFFYMIKARPQMFETIYNNLDIINNGVEAINTKRFVFNQDTQTASVEDFNISFNPISSEINIPSCIGKNTIDDLDFIYNLGDALDDMNRLFFLDYKDESIKRYRMLEDD